MLRQEPYSLNALSHDTAADLISLVLVRFAVFAGGGYIHMHVCVCLPRHHTLDIEREMCTCVCHATPTPSTHTPQHSSPSTQAEGVTVTEVFVDTVGDPEMYQRKLQGLFAHHTPAIQVGIYV